MKKKTTPNKKKITKKKVSEQDLLNTIDIISKKLAYKFKFGYHEYEDMKQQITVFALEGLKNYDGIRPLENFLWTHVRNRLFNYKRDNYQRPNKPCLTCPLYDPQKKVSSSQCSKYKDKNDCELYNSWNERNSVKKNLMYLTGVEDYSLIDKPNDKESSNDYLANKEILDILDKELLGEEREIYLRYRGGSKVNKPELTKLLNKIKTILGNNNE